MNDWSNDDMQPGDLVDVRLKPGDLVHIHSANARMSPIRWQPLVRNAIVIALDPPPVGSLQTYDATVLLPDGRIITAYRQNLQRAGTSE